MTDLLMQGLAPLTTVVLLLWAALVALAAESTTGIAGAEGYAEPGLPTARKLHVAHLALLFLGAVAGAITLKWWQAPLDGQLVRLLLIVGLVWIIGDLLPRMAAALEPGFAGPALRAAKRTLLPFGILFRLVAWADSRGRRSQDPPPNGGEPNVVQGLFSLGESTVADVMTPRLDIESVDYSSTLDQILDTLRQSEHARLLVYRGGADEIAGVLYAKDVLALLAESGDGEAWTQLVRPATYVPEGKPLERQLQDFQRGPQHLAVVVDEYGGTAGLITLEDILEEIVGEIQDEYDTSEVAEISPVGPDSWLVQGVTPLDDLEELLAIDFGREDVNTVGGLVLAEFGRVPRPRESLVLHGCRITVDQMVRRRVKRLLVERLPAEADGGEQ